MIVVMENKKMSYEEAQKALAEQDRYVGVVLEALNDKVDVLVEGQEAMEVRMDRFDGRMNRLEVKVDHLDTEVVVIREKLDVVVDDINKKAEKRDFIALEHRVKKLEAF
jgi:ribosome assembly protein YihI (activator of Der GTPase)